MADFTLVRHPRKTWSVDIDGNIYAIPLGGSLTTDEAEEIKTPEGTRTFFGRYIGKDVYSKLTISEQNAVIRAWQEATAKAGTNLGE
jgi:hypothetical protein